MLTKNVLLPLFVLFLGISAQAGELRGGLNYFLSSESSIDNANTLYNNSGFGLGIDYFFTKDLLLPKAVGTIWGLGVNYSTLNAKKTSSGVTSVLYPEEFKHDMIQANILFALTYHRLRLELPLGFSFLKETSGINVNDEKYGLNFGANLYCKFFQNLHLGVGYENILFGHGKNYSAGTQGSLANKIDMTNIKMTLAYTHTFGGLRGLR